MIRRVSALAGCLLAILWVASRVGPSAQQPGPVLFEGARLITGEESPPMADSAFLVENRRFTAVGRRGDVALPPGGVRVDLAGKTVMPALIELHAHLGYWKGWNTSKDYYTRETILDDLQRLAYYGVTAVLSLGADRREIVYELRDEWRASPPPDAARFFTAGPGISMPDAGPAGELRDAVYEVRTEAEARAAVQELAANGIDGWIKIWHDSRRALLPPPVYQALIDEAHRQGLRVTAHTHELEHFEDLLRAGIDGFAHPTWRQTSVEPVDRQLLDLFRQNPDVFVATSFWTPRNQIYGPRPYWIDEPHLRDVFTPDEVARLERPRTPPDTAEAWANGPVPRSVRRLKAAGVRFGLGTDMGGGGPAYFGFSSHVELESLVRAGLTPAEAITAATKNSAEILGVDDLGTIAIGKSADFLVLDANPLDDIANTRRISRVYLRGVEVDRAGLRAKWAAARSTYREVENWAALPPDTEWGPVSGVSTDAAASVYAFRRREPPVLKFDANGAFLGGLAADLIVGAHGLRVGPRGNIWLADVTGHVVHELSPEGEVLMTLGTRGVSGTDERRFNGPTDVLVTPAGDIFVSDGQAGASRRVVRFTANGAFVREWGSGGSAPGQFGVPHALAMDSRGRLFVADRDNGRIQIFDQEGTFLEAWSQFGSPSGVFIAPDDTLYVAALGERSGLLIGSAQDGRVDQWVPIPAEGNNGPHLVSVDPRGAVYVADLLANRLRKYVDGFLPPAAPAPLPAGDPRRR